MKRRDFIRYYTWNPAPSLSSVLSAVTVASFDNRQSINLQPLALSPVHLKLRSFTGLPLLPSDATLTKEAGEEINADFTFVRIGKDQTGHGSDHKFMPPARVRAIESKLMQSFYEFTAGNWGQTAHLTRDLVGRAN